METPETETANEPRQSNIAFLLKEYEELWAQARHVDEYMERVPRFFLTVVGAATAAITALIQFSDRSSFLFAAGGIALILLSLIGFIASLTIPRYRVIRLGYFNATYLIRKYFVNKAAELRNFMWFPIEGTFKGYYQPLRIDFFRFTMMAIMDSSLMFAGLYAVWNSEALANPDQSVLYLIWALSVGILFFAIHYCLYFFIIWFYEKDDRKRSESLELLKDPNKS